MKPRVKNFKFLKCFSCNPVLWSIHTHTNLIRRWTIAQFGAAFPNREQIRVFFGLKGSTPIQESAHSLFHLSPILHRPGIIKSKSNSCLTYISLNIWACKFSPGQSNLSHGNMVEKTTPQTNPQMIPEGLPPLSPFQAISNFLWWPMKMHLPIPLLTVQGHYNNLPIRGTGRDSSLFAGKPKSSGMCSIL